jgi:hypothetical protein
VSAARGVIPAAAWHCRTVGRFAAVSITTPGYTSVEHGADPQAAEQTSNHPQTRSSSTQPWQASPAATAIAAPPLPLPGAFNSGIGAMPCSSEPPQQGMQLAAAAAICRPCPHPPSFSSTPLLYSVPLQPLTRMHPSPAPHDHCVSCPPPPPPTCCHPPPVTWPPGLGSAPA